MAEYPVGGIVVLRAEGAESIKRQMRQADSREHNDAGDKYQRQKGIDLMQYPSCKDEKQPDTRKRRHRHKYLADIYGVPRNGVVKALL